MKKFCKLKINDAEKFWKNFFSTPCDLRTLEAKKYKKIQEELKKMQDFHRLPLKPGFNVCLFNENVKESTYVSLLKLCKMFESVPRSLQLKQILEKWRNAF